MATYIARRLLLMIPTLLGISFVVFTLVALSPGGVSAVLQDGGNVQGPANSAVLRAYFEDRYGLDEPVLGQYLRWLAHVSPLKFGVQNQIAPNGETLRPPRPLKPPPLWSWFTEDLPRPLQIASPVEVAQAAKAAAYRSAAARYAIARSESVAAAAELSQGLVEYARATGRQDAVMRDGTVRLDRLATLSPDRTHAAWERLRPLGARAIEAYGRESTARSEAAAAFDSAPYPKAGLAIIPGIVSIAAPDFGVAYSTGRPVAAMIREALPVTLLLNLVAIPIIYAIAIPGGILAAAWRGSIVDRGLGAVFVALWSVPVVLAGVAAIGFLAGPDYLGAFPISGLHDDSAGSMRFLPSWKEGGPFQRGYLLDLLWHICLPVLCLVYGGLAILSKQTRAAMLDNMAMEYVRTARAKGVDEPGVMLRHVFRNSLLPLITMFVAIFPAMLSGSVVVEKIFSVPGMGSLVMQAISFRDRELLLANTMMIAAVSLAALLLADVLYAIADPRVSYRSG